MVRFKRSELALGSESRESGFCFASLTWGGETEGTKETSPFWFNLFVPPFGGFALLAPLKPPSWEGSVLLLVLAVFFDAIYRYLHSFNSVDEVASSACKSSPSTFLMHLRRLALKLFRPVFAHKAT